MNEVTIITDYSKYDLDIRKTFNSIDGDTLLDMDLPATKFVIKDLLPQGLAILGGAPKVGKSWLMLDWCVRIAKGETIWNFPTTKGTTLYVSLEDTASRLQERLLSVTDEAPNVFFTTFSFKIGEGLE
ncbi:MAG: AAA family ATPase, partial [Clostridia bacterium]|nr:AAA family ATPase [Clostridia bacterium]